MGHIRLGNLPRTRKWQQVVALLDSGAATTDQVAAATLDASKQGLEEAGHDPALAYSFWLLTQLPLCARKSDYSEELRKLGISVASDPGLLDLVGAFSDSVDAHIRRIGGRTDLGEMAQMGAAESLTSTLRQQTESLFGTTPADVQRELAKLATPKNFSLLARDFFSRLSERYLTYFLSRELSNHRSVDENRQFREALSLHCKQASKIVEQFAGGWYSKTNFEGGITQRKAANFIQVALKTAAKRSCAVLALSRRREDRASRPCNAIQSRGRAPTRVTAGACDLPHGFRPKPAGGSYCISSG